MIRILLLFLIFNIYTFAHPHVFFTSDFTINIENNEIKTLDITVFLDELNTVLFSENLPQDRNILQKDLPFYENVIHDIHLEWNGANKVVNPIFENASLDNDILKLSIKVPIYEKIESNSSLIFSIYDSEYFYTYDYEKEDFHLNINNTDFSTKLSLKENLKKPFYYGMVYPKEFEVNFY